MCNGNPYDQDGAVSALRAKQANNKLLELDIDDTQDVLHCNTSYNNTRLGRNACLQNTDMNVAVTCAVPDIELSYLRPVPFVVAIIVLFFLIAVFMSRRFLGIRFVHI